MLKIFTAFKLCFAFQIKQNNYHLHGSDITFDTRSAILHHKLSVFVKITPSPTRILCKFSCYFPFVKSWHPYNVVLWMRLTVVVQGSNNVWTIFRVGVQVVVSRSMVKPNKLPLRKRILVPLYCFVWIRLKQQNVNPVC